MMPRADPAILFRALRSGAEQLPQQAMMLPVRILAEVHHTVGATITVDAGFFAG